jgi:nitrous oxidase accessory protein
MTTFNRNIFIIILLLFNQAFLPAATVRVVDKDKNSYSIKQAVIKAQAGDTILVKAGIYQESAIEINKQLTVIGEKNAIIDARNEKGNIIRVKAQNVTISGLEFKNVAVSYINDNAAIKLDSCQDCIIRNNTFINNFFSIYLARSFRCKIENNIIKSNAERETASGNGIHLWYCKEITVKNNRIEGQRDGIYFEFVEQSHVSQNHSEKNLRYGLHFMFSDHCTYDGNEFINNGAGVAVMYTHYVDMHNNLFAGNWGPASFGLLLKEITDSKIASNHFERNSTAIYAESANRINIYNNQFEQNGWAVKIMGNCLDNQFYKNNFIANTFDVTTNTRRNFNRFETNYWDNYQGYDLDKDGYGDVPFRPVTLFSYLVEKNEPSLIFIRSLFVYVLNIAERIMPVLTPNTLVDSRPLMKRAL